jgi:hypothetical protein
MSYTEVEVTKVILTKKVKDFGQLAIKKRGILDIRTRITSYIRNRLNLGEPLIFKNLDEKSLSTKSLLSNVGE